MDKPTLACFIIVFVIVLTMFIWSLVSYTHNGCGKCNGNKCKGNKCKGNKSSKNKCEEGQVCCKACKET